MADIPSDIRWPPGTVVDYDDIFDRALEIKARYFPQHTARDANDPYIQLISLASALGQYALGQMNSSLLNLSPKTARSRSAIIAIMEFLNRPLAPITPAQGTVYAKVTSTTITPGDVLVSADQRLAEESVQDPVFTVDSEVEYPAATVFGTHFDYSADTETEVSPITAAVATGDALILEYGTLAFDAITVAFSAKYGTADASVSVEYRNTEYGEVDSVTDLGSQLRFVLDTYLHLDETSVDAVGLSVTVRHRPSGVGQTVEVAVVSGSLTATTSLLGQSSPSSAASDYDVLADWRPIPNVVDGTGGLSATGAISWSISDLFSSTDYWAADPANGRYGIRLRVIDPGSNASPTTITLTAAITGDEWLIANVTQGVRVRTTLGNTDGTTFQHLTLPTALISEPSASGYTLEVGTDLAWSVVDDFSNSDGDSKHAILREDPDDGWQLVFGNGTIGKVPGSGESVRLTYRTRSIASGNIDAGTVLRHLGGLGNLNTWNLFRGASGYAAPEASDRDSVFQFRASILPQIALRAESVVTEPEIEQALSGGAPNRGTFTTSDGRKPFSRAFFTLEGAGTRQYRVLVVGSESSPAGIVRADDLTEAEEWLNGVTIGLSRIGGHGPNNTEALVTAFTPRYILPTITVTIANQRGIPEQVETIVRQFLRPHARDDDENWRWSVGGRVPLAVLFSQLWSAVPERVYISISATDGITTWDTGDFIQLAATELPVLDPTFDSAVNVVLVDP